MDTLSRARRAIEHPILFLRHANRLYHRRLNRRHHNIQGVDIFDEDWDTLIILDACRYDIFEQRSELPGELERRQSKGSATTEFLTANFTDRTLSDTVYVTANPQLYRKLRGVCEALHSVVHIWREEGWDDDHGTVLPKTVTEYAIRAARDYPNKRLVVHYMQPHYPFIGAEGGNLGRPLADPDSDEENERDEENIWNRALTDGIPRTRDEIWQLYVDNLDCALPHVEELLTTLTGRTVVTSDHGNMIGERSHPIPITEWGHPRGTYTNELVTVPWLVHDNGQRRTIRAGESSAEYDEIEDEIVAERLRNLGYTE